MARCVCCGKSWPFEPKSRTASGPIHFECWDEHHSDPTGTWPPSHVCALEPADASNGGE